MTRDGASSLLGLATVLIVGLWLWTDQGKMIWLAQTMMFCG